MAGVDLGILYVRRVFRSAFRPVPPIAFSEDLLFPISQDAIKQAQMSFLQSLTPANPAPLDYVTPPFPSLYWPFPIRGGQANYLYHATDIWRFTVLWTLVFYAAVHFSAVGYAIVIQWKNWKVIWIVPIVYAVIGGIEAFIAGSVVGGLIGGVYNAGYFRMSTWIPFVWALINTLVLILSSFAIQGGL